jgi:hypothetical protein
VTDGTGEKVFDGICIFVWFGALAAMSVAGICVDVEVGTLIAIDDLLLISATVIVPMRPIIATMTGIHIEMWFSFFCCSGMGKSLN